MVACVFRDNLAETPALPQPWAIPQPWTFTSPKYVSGLAGEKERSQQTRSIDPGGTNSATLPVTTAAAHPACPEVTACISTTFNVR